MQIHIGAMTRVPRDALVDPTELLAKLTIPNGQYSSRKLASGAEIPRFFALAEPAGDDILVPRAYDVSPDLWKTPPVVSELVDPDGLWPRVELGEDRVELGPNRWTDYDQKPGWEALSSPLAWPYGRIFNLRCGGGKSALGLKLAHLRGRPTIVVCHTLQMMEKWSEEAERLLGYARRHHGFIGDGRFDWEGRNLVFTTMQGLHARLEDLSRDFWEAFGLVLFDEGDLLGATKMSRILPRFLGERVLLTATVMRRDGNHDLYFKHVGDVCFSDIKPELEPTCVVLDTPVPPVIKIGKRRYPAEATVREEGHVPKTVTRLEKYPPRTDFAFKLVTEALHAGRKVLFIGERVDGLKAMHARAQAELPEFPSGLILGKRHVDLASLSKTIKACRVIWGIKQIARRGLDAPDVDTLVLQYASFQDFGAVQQTVGRALRDRKGKQHPVLFILHDVHAPCLSRNVDSIVRQLSEYWGYRVEWYSADTDRRTD